ncbi:MAG: hypothetical protein WD060_07525 [Pirellulales bacterium]
MSTTEILAVLGRMTPDERRQIARRLAELDGLVIDSRGSIISEGDLAELRARLDRFAAEWDSPEMTLYDDYDTSRASMEPR